MNLEKLSSLAVDVARGANSLLLEICNEKEKKVLSAEGRDVKLEADFRLDKYISDRLLAESPYSVLSEELGLQKKQENESTLRWIVDPIDGSMNFLRGIQGYACSIALWNGDEPVLGVIYDFSTNDLYEGVVGEGSKLNGFQIKTSQIESSKDGVLATGFPIKDSFDENSIREKVSLFQNFKKIRMFGTAALSLAYVSSGKVDSYSESGIRLWDVAAGLALVKASGGSFQMTKIDNDTTYKIIATNGKIHV